MFVADVGSDSSVLCLKQILEVMGNCIVCSRCGE